jgi:anti-sigma factor RsiW
MKCEWVKENVLLYVYNELPDDARYELEQHLARCADCTAELKTTRKFHAMLSELPVEEPSPNLVAASRMRLQEGLETAEQGRFWHRLIFDPAAWFRQIRFAPALAAAIFIVGCNYFWAGQRTGRILHHGHSVGYSGSRIEPHQH